MARIEIRRTRELADVRAYKVELNREVVGKFKASEHSTTNYRQESIA